MKVVPVEFSLIDFEDHTFYVGSKEDISSLKESISELGVLNPPIVISLVYETPVPSGRKVCPASKSPPTTIASATQPYWSDTSTKYVDAHSPVKGNKLSIKEMPIPVVVSVNWIL